jgi:hypothetical protein
MSMARWADRRNVPLHHHVHTYLPPLINWPKRAADFSLKCSASFTSVLALVLDCDVLLLFCRTLTQILYYTIVLSVAGMSGNPFLNFLLQALIELPGFLVGRAVCDRLGRRWSQAGAFVLTGCLQLACLVITVREYRLPYRDCYSTQTTRWFPRGMRGMW